LAVIQVALVALLQLLFGHFERNDPAELRLFFQFRIFLEGFVDPGTQVVLEHMAWAYYDSLVRSMSRPSTKIQNILVFLSKVSPPKCGHSETATNYYTLRLAHNNEEAFAYMGIRYTLSQYRFWYELTHLTAAPIPLPVAHSMNYIIASLLVAFRHHPVPPLYPILVPLTTIIFKAFLLRMIC